MADAPADVSAPQPPAAEQGPSEPQAGDVAAPGPSPQSEQQPQAPAAPAPEAEEPAAAAAPPAAEPPTAEAAPAEQPEQEAKQEAAEQPAPGEAALAEPQTAPKEEEQAQAAGDAAVEGAAASAEAGAAAGPPSDAALVARLKELLAEVDLATTTGGCWARGLGSAAPPRRALAACLSALACMASRGGGHAPCPAHPPLPHAARPRDRHRCREAAAQAAGGRVWVRAGRPQGAAARRDQRVPGGAGGWGGS